MGFFEDHLLTIEGLDYGDAPDVSGISGPNNYQTVAANDGPRHSIAGPILGTLVDAEFDGLQSPDAQGDDEDGLNMVSTIVALPAVSTTASMVVMMA